MTSHELAAQLLAGEDLPIVHHCRHYVEFIDEWEHNHSTPAVQYNSLKGRFEITEGELL